MDDKSIEQEIIARGLTAPRVTLVDVLDAIAGETFTMLPSGKVMVCELTLRNGFTVLGESATVSRENFNAELGRRISHDKAVNKVWELLGYALAERLAGDRTVRDELRKDAGPTPT